LCDYLTTDALFGKFFDVFVFEQLPAMNSDAKKVYLDKVKQCDIYLGLFGKNYGYEDNDGISPTEREFDCATENHKIKLIFLTNHTSEEREPKENQLIKKAEQFVIRKKFSNDLELKTAVYNSLVRFLEENEYIRTTPFDATFNRKATIEDLDEEKIRSFVYTAHRKRAFPFTKDTEIETVLTHLNLIENQKVTNAAILLFGKNPQKFFITSEVRCAHFHGYDKVKPIPNYQVYKGDVFQLITQAVSFVLSCITVSTGARDKGVEVDVNYELPVRVVTEAIVNAVCHRDYTSNASVQVMLFKDRLEIWNPGHLPFGMTVAKLKQKHNSVPVNPLIAEPLYLAGTIERMGTGTEEMIDKCKQAGLKEPEFVEEESFTVTLWRNLSVGDTDTPQVNTQVEKLVRIFNEGVLTINDLMQILHFKERRTFARNYIQPAIELGLIEMTIPDKPNSRLQKYRLTQKGIDLKNTLQNKIKNQDYIQ
jgi:predicted HTH transcriptional regulator